MGTWLVTGASRGLGRSLASQLAGLGHPVLACARDLAALQALAAETPGAPITPCRLDLADASGVANTLNMALAPLPPLAGIINNAGIGYYKAFVEHSEAELIGILQVNLLATMQICHALLPRLLEQGAGHIVNIGSDLGRRPLANMAAYVASKHGLAGFSHSLLREVKSSGVKVSLINPGMIDTGFGGGSDDLRDPRQHLKPEALAKLIVQMIGSPRWLVVDELSVHPLQQSEF